jgi:hypothetical protein
LQSDIEEVTNIGKQYMNTHELMAELKKNDIDSHTYSVDSGNPHPGQYVLEKFGKYTWAVYSYDDRGGGKSEPMLFSSEDEACRYFLDWLLNDLTTRKRS